MILLRTLIGTKTKDGVKTYMRLWFFDPQYLFLKVELETFCSRQTHYIIN